MLASPPLEEPPQQVLPHLQMEAPLEDVLAASPQPQEQVLARPQTKAPLKDVRPPPQLVESLVSVLVTPLPEEPRRLGFLAL